MVFQLNSAKNNHKSCFCGLVEVLLSADQGESDPRNFSTEDHACSDFGKPFVELALVVIGKARFILSRV